jgi:hypothetical protein
MPSGIKDSVILDKATGETALEKTLYFCPSIFKQFIKPIIPIFAAP